MWRTPRRSASCRAASSMAGDRSTAVTLPGDPRTEAPGARHRTRTSVESGVNSGTSRSSMTRRVHATYSSPPAKNARSVSAVRLVRRNSGEVSTAKYGSRRANDSHPESGSWNSKKCLNLTWFRRGALGAKFHMNLRRIAGYYAPLTFGTSRKEQHVQHDAPQRGIRLVGACGRADDSARQGPGAWWRRASPDRYLWRLGRHQQRRPAAPGSWTGARRLHRSAAERRRLPEGPGVGRDDSVAARAPVAGTPGPVLDARPRSGAAHSEDPRPGHPELRSPTRSPAASAAPTA